VLFATDRPFDPEGGPMFIRETIAALDGLTHDGLHDSPLEGTGIRTIRFLLFVGTARA